MSSIELGIPEPLLTNEQISELADPGRRTDDTPIIRSLAIADIAEGLDISLDLTDVAIAVGEETPSTRDSAFQAVKACVPFLHSRNNKLAKVWDTEITSIWNELEERKIGLELSNWIGTLTPIELEHVEVVDDDYGNKYLSPLQLTVKGIQTATQSFELGDHFNYGWEDDYGPFAALPNTVRDRLKDKQAFWEGFVKNGVELGDFRDENFTKIKVDFDKGKLPAEIAWLQVKDVTELEQERIFTKLQAIHKKSGRDIYLSVMRKMPQMIVDDTLKIGRTQEKFMSTWLPGFVKHNITPAIHDTDTQAIRATHDVVRTRYENDDSIQSDFKRRYLLTEVDQQLKDDLAFEQSLRNIEHLRSLVLGIEIAGGTDDVETQNVIDQANALLNTGLSGEKVTDRILIDTVLYTTENAKQILELIPPLLGVAEGLQHMPVAFIRHLADAVGSGDDFLGEASEVSNLRAHGYTWSELRNRFGFVGSVAVGAVALGTQITAIESIDPRIAAVAYAVTTFATTAATLIATMRVGTRAFKSLAAQGKLQEMLYLSSTQCTQLQRAIIEAPSPEAAAEAAQKHMHTLLADYQNISQKEILKRIKGVTAAAYQRDPEQAMKYVTPSRKEALQAAYAEVFGINDLRKGKMQSMPLMLGLAAMTGGVLLSTPFFFIPFGMLESLGGLARAKFAIKHEDAAWQKKVIRLTNELRANVGNLVLQAE